MLELRTLGVLDLRKAGEPELWAVLQQPKRLALLTYLAITATGRFLRRDTLLGLFWPELDAEHARGALRRSLYFLRKAVGDDVVIGRGEEELGIAAGSLWADVPAFREAVRAGDARRALELYQGDFLEGFYVAGAPDVEDWFDRERRHLRAEAHDQMRHLARASAEPSEAMRWARRALEIESEDAEMRSVLTRPAVPRGSPALPGIAQAPPVFPDAASRVAICPFAVRAAPSLGFLAEGMVDLLATRLDGAGAVRIIDPRMVLTGGGDGPGFWSLERGRVLSARTGAGSFVLGSVVEVAGRLEATATLHRADGTVESRVEARAENEAELFELVDQLALGLLAALQEPGGYDLSRLAAMTTDSLPALKAWLAGEQAHRLARYLEALEAFRQATAADPSFALAWHRLAATFAATALIEPARHAAGQAHRHRERLAEHARQLLDAQLAWLSGQSGEAERRYAAVVTAWPEALEGWFLLGDVQFHSNPYRGRSVVQARDAFRHALALDPNHLGSVVQLARIAALEGRLDELDELVARALRLSAASDQALGLRALRAFARRDDAEQAAVTAELVGARGLVIARAFSDVTLYAGNPDGAERLARDLFAAARSEEFRAFGMIAMAHLDLARGRVIESFDRLREAERLDPSWGLATRGLFATLPFVVMSPSERSAIRDELERWDAEGTRPAIAIPLAFHNGLAPHLRAFLLSLLSIRLGELDRAALAAEALAELPEPPGTAALLQHLGRTLDAELKRARGEPAAALAVLEMGRLDVWFQYAVTSPFYAGTFERFLRAELLFDTGRIPEALRWWGAIAERSPFELPFLAPALTRQGEAWRALGDEARAAAAHAAARVLWGTRPSW